MTQWWFLKCSIWTSPTSSLFLAHCYELLIGWSFQDICTWVLYEKKKTLVNLGITHALGIFSCIYVVHPPKWTLAPKSYRATPMSFSGCIAFFPPEKVQILVSCVFQHLQTRIYWDFGHLCRGYRPPESETATRLPVSHGIAAWPCHHGNHGIANCEQHEGMMHDVWCVKQ